MANGNDPANIPYIIAENGFYYVAYKEKVKDPDVVVSAKGVANGLSEEYNDGWDFGPDSYDPNSTANPPYTQTSGMQEAYEFAVANNQGLDTVIKLVSNETYVIDEEINFTYIPEIAGALQQSVDIVADGRLGTSIKPSSSFTGSYLFNLGAISFGAYNILFSGNSSVGLFENSGATNNQVFDYHWYNCYFGGSTDQFNLNATYSSCRYEFWDCQFVPNSASFGSFNINGNNDTSVALFFGCDFSISSGYHGFEFGALSVYMIGNYQHISNGLSPSPLINTTNSTLLHTLYVSGHQFMDTDSAFFIYFGSTNSGVIKRLYIYGSNWPNNTQSFIEGYYSGAITQIKSDMLNSNSLSGTIGLMTYISPTLSANPPVSATVYQNTNPYAIEIDLPVYATTAGTAGYVTVAKGKTDTPTAIGNQYVSGDTSDTSEQIIRLRVPAGWYYEFTASGVTFGTASVFAD